MPRHAAKHKKQLTSRRTVVTFLGLPSLASTCLSGVAHVSMSPKGPKKGCCPTSLKSMPCHLEQTRHGMGLFHCRESITELIHCRGRSPELLTDGDCNHIHRAESWRFNSRGPCPGRARSTATSRRQTKSRNNTKGNQLK